MVKDMSLIWYIHGAASTPLSFNWLKTQFPKHEIADVMYDNVTPLNETIEILRDKAADEERPINMIGHSLGGVIAASIAQAVPVRRIVTMGTPFGGSFAASVMRWFMPNQLYRDIAQQSPVMTSLRENPPNIPIMSFVTNSGLVVLGEATDGVVTVKSQKALRGPEYIDVNTNHFEVLLNPEVASLTKRFIFGKVRK